MLHIDLSTLHGSFPLFILERRSELRIMFNLRLDKPGFEVEIIGLREEIPLDNKKLKSQFSMLLSAIKLAIDEWNPYDLLPCAPSDEFDGESRMIAAKIKVDDTVDTIAEIVSDIFSRQFEPKGFLVEDCQDMAEKIRLNIDNLSLK